MDATINGQDPPLFQKNKMIHRFPPPGKKHPQIKHFVSLLSLFTNPNSLSPSLPLSLHFVTNATMFEAKDALAQRRSSFSCAVPFVIISSLSRRSLLYNKLPQKPLKLTVLKLDDSSFEIEVAKTATVAELRMSVENAFSHLPKQGSGKVSWSHVWGHFCLCFDGQKLLDDNEYIADYEIRDGDQLLFARHLSINYNMKSRSPEQIGDYEQPSISNTGELEEEIDDGTRENCDDRTSRQDDEEDRFSVTAHEYKRAAILRG